MTHGASVKRHAFLTEKEHIRTILMHGSNMLQQNVSTTAALIFPYKAQTRNVVNTAQPEKFTVIAEIRIGRIDLQAVARRTSMLKMSTEMTHALHLSRTGEHSLAWKHRLVRTPTSKNQ